MALFSRKGRGLSRSELSDKGANTADSNQPRYSAVGVDISTSAVKVLEMDRGRDGYKATHVGIEPLPRDASVERAISNLDAVGEAVAGAGFALMARPAGKALREHVPTTFDQGAIRFRQGFGEIWPRPGHKLPVRRRP